MGEFGYSLKCDACGLWSPGVPFRLDFFWYATEAMLVVADTANRRFDCLQFPLPHAELKAFIADDDADERVLAAALRLCSAGQHPVLPYLTGNGIEIRPAIACPRCGVPGVRADYGQDGYPPRLPAVPCESVREMTAAALARPSDEHRFVLGTDIEVSRDFRYGEDRPPVWKVRCTGPAQAETARALIAELLRHGIRCEPPRLREHGATIVECPPEM